MSYEYERKQESQARKGDIAKAFDAPRQSEGGRPLQVPDALSSRIQKSFGLDPAALRFEESPQVMDRGFAAEAQGDTVRFAPGAYKPDTPEGLSILGHELNHVAQQARGEVPMTGGILEEPAYEDAADQAGQAFASGAMASASGTMASAESAQAPASAASAPVQGFGIPKFLKSIGRRRGRRRYNNTGSGINFSTLSKRRETQEAPAISSDERYERAMNVVKGKAVGFPWMQIDRADLEGLSREELIEKILELVSELGG